MDLEVTRRSLQRMADQYLDGRDPTDPSASPIYADLSGFPPLLVQVGGFEVLLDDAVALTRRAAIADTRVVLEIWPEMQHCYPLGVVVYPEAAAALTQAGEWLAGVIRTSSSRAQATAR